MLHKRFRISGQYRVLCTVFPAVSFCGSFFLVISIPEFPLAADGPDGVWGNAGGASILSDGTHVLYYTGCSGTARYLHGTAGTHGFYDAGFRFFDIQPESNWDECSFAGRLTAAGGSFTGNYAGITASGFTVSMRDFKTAAGSVDIPSVSATGFTVSVPFFSGKGRASQFCIEPFFTAGFFSCSRGTTASLDKIQPSAPCFISCGMHLVLFPFHYMTVTVPAVFLHLIYRTVTGIWMLFSVRYCFQDYHALLC